MKNVYNLVGLLDNFFSSKDIEVINMSERDCYSVVRDARLWNRKSPEDREIEIVHCHRYRYIFSICFNMKVCCVFLLESPQYKTEKSP